MKSLTFDIKLSWLIGCCHMLWIYDELKIDSIWLFKKIPNYLFNNPWKEKLIKDWLSPCYFVWHLNTW